ncbi:MAG: peptidase S8 [Bacillaceae bacterium]|nr:peptidase S8 [Bacillaceae bacterium]
MTIFFILVTISLMSRQEVQPPDEPLTRINYIGHVEQIKTRLDQNPQILSIKHNPQAKSHFIEKEVTVKFKEYPDQNEIDQITREIDGKIKKRLDHTSIFKSRTLSTPELIDYFEQREDVRFAEPNYLLLPNVVPNDQFYQDYQWNLDMLGLEKGWELSGGSEVIVAVVDTGVDLDHSDFSGQLVTGHNILFDNDQADDDNGHGTHVAGVVAAATNNYLGVAGISWNSKIMPVKGIGGDGTGSAFDIANGIIWATDRGADVINLSVGNYTPSQVLHDAIRYAFERDVVLVAASGNDNTSQPGYPAAYPEVLAVGAVNYLSQRANFSNYGDYLDVVAPGVDIPSTYINDQYASLSGTSMASPHVAGLAALIRSRAPNLSNQEVMDIIRDTATDLGSVGKDPYYGYGLIDGYKALNLIAGNEATPPETQDYNRTPLQFLMRLFRDLLQIETTIPLFPA